MSKNTLIPNQRHLFDMPDNIAYLNCAYMSPLMKPVVDAADVGVQYKVQPWTYTGADFFKYSEEYRSLGARLINTDADNIAIVPSASYGLQIAANNLSLGEGREILMIADQFPSNVYPWREMAKANGGMINTVARPENGDWTEAVLQAINPLTQIVTLPATHWADGGYLDLEIIGMATRSVGAALVLDLTQSLGAMPFDVETVRPDFMVSAGYKWLMGPYSLGILYIAPQYHAGMPLEHNWMNRKGSEDFSRLVDYQDTFQPGARRFDMGEKSNPAQLKGASAALSQLLGWGIKNISGTLGARNSKIADRARDIGLNVQEDKYRSPHFLGLGFANGIPDGFAETLAGQDIFVSVRGSSVRVTPHLYNNNVDIDCLFSAIETAV